MKVEIKVDETVRETKVMIFTDKITPEISAIVTKLSEDAPDVIVGFRGEAAEVIERDDIVSVYASDGKVFIRTDKGEHRIRKRLYEIEEILDGNRFIRISNSEIINLKKVKELDLSFRGTICVVFRDGSRSFASRRYINRIKEVLGI